MSAFHCKRETAAYESLQRARVVRVNLAMSFSARISRKAIFMPSRIVRAPRFRPFFAVSDGQDYLAHGTRLDQADKAHRSVMPVIGHEEYGRPIEQMGQDGRIASDQMTSAMKERET